jgi:hypothetical protein
MVPSGFRRSGKTLILSEAKCKNMVAADCRNILPVSRREDIVSEVTERFENE